MTAHGTRETRHHNVLTAVTQSSPRLNSTDHGAETTGSGTRTTDSRVELFLSLVLSLSRRRFVTVVAVSMTTSSFTTASPCWRFVRIVTVTLSCLTMFCVFAASRDAWLESAGSASLIFSRMPVILLECPSL